MKLYSGPLSLFSRKVEIALAEKGLAFEREMVPFSQAEGYAPKHPAVLAANPKGQVPVLIDGETTLFDSTVIFEYLEDRYPEPPLYPAEPAARARCRLLELRADEVLLPPLVKLMVRTEPPNPDPEQQRLAEEGGREGEAALERLLGELDRELEGRDYLCDILTVADIATFMSLLFAKRLGGPGPDAFANLESWDARLRARPAFAGAAAEIAEADRLLSV